MNSNLTEDSSHFTINAACKHHISTIDELTKRALFLFKMEMFIKVVKKVKQEYDFNEAIISLSHKATTT